jgi:hypothetical protein
MGLFDIAKKSKEINKKAEWKIGAIPTIVELEEDHFKLINTGKTEAIFYKDIVSVEQSINIVNIRTKVKTYSLRARKLRGGSDKAQELQLQILEKINEYK